MHALLDLSTEVLIDILSFLPAADMFSVRQTCHAIRDIIDGTAYLQYILCTDIMGVDDLLPPDFPISDRFKLLRRHEQSRNALQFNMFTKCFIDLPSYIQQFILQGGYFIYDHLTADRMWKYGYTDLCAATRNEELLWVHIEVLFPSSARLIFAVDHNLVVVMSNREHQDGETAQEQLAFAFIEFTTGTPHPLSPTHDVLLPLPLFCTASDIFIGKGLLGDDGDYILVSAWASSYAVVFYSVAWKTGIVSFLRDFSDVRPDTEAPFVVIDSSLIALIRGKLNRLEIYRLEVCPSTGVPLLQTAYLLELPPVTSITSVIWGFSAMEWVPTSRHYKRSRSSRGYHIPFYSSKVGTMGLLLHYRVASGYSLKCTMIISIVGLLSAIRTRVDYIPWEEWGPSITHFFQKHLSLTVGPTIGPFWIERLSPLRVRDYGLICKGDIVIMAEDMSSWQSRSLPMVSSTKVYGEHWVEHQVETYLPYRDIVANDLHIDSDGFVLTDREWIVCRGFEYSRTRSITVYHLDLPPV